MFLSYWRILAHDILKISSSRSQVCMRGQYALMLPLTPRPPLRMTATTCCSVALACSLDPSCPRLPLLDPDPQSLILDPWSFILVPWSLILVPWSLILDPWSFLLSLDLFSHSKLSLKTTLCTSGIHRVIASCEARRFDCLEHCRRLRRLQRLLHRLQQDLPAADHGGQVGGGAAREEARQHALRRRRLHLCHEKAVECSLDHLQLPCNIVYCQTYLWQYALWWCRLRLCDEKLEDSWKYRFIQSKWAYPIWLTFSW